MVTIFFLSNLPFGLSVDLTIPFGIKLWISTPSSASLVQERSAEPTNVAITSLPFHTNQESEEVFLSPLPQTVLR